MNRINNSKRALSLAVGDLVVYVFSLILTLTIRYHELPTKGLLTSHLPSFSTLFIIFVIVGFSAGLYDKQFSFLRGRVAGALIKSQIVNIFIGIAFFYLAPVAIAPKANLAIFFVLSTALLFIWRTVMFPVFSISRLQSAILIGSGNDIDDLYEEVNGNPRYGLSFKVKLQDNASAEQIADRIKRHNTQIIVVNLHNKAIEGVTTFLYSQIFAGKGIIDASRLYEAIFDRIPLSMVGEKWLIENTATLGARRLYDLVKRVMDIVVASVIGLISLVIYPFVFAAIKMEDGGQIFIHQKRIGKGGHLIDIVKFRSMTGNDSGAYGSNGGKTALTVTKVGKFIRLTRIDELPQLWSVLKGDQSLIGPRPEFPSLVSVYEKEIPYYNIRHLIKPGLSGWAQIYHKKHPHHEIATGEARNKLFYDLYYVKNRSLTLDLKIALQTTKALLSRQGV